jgi:hypothetical protein
MIPYAIAIGVWENQNFLSIHLAKTQKMGEKITGFL